MAQTQAAPEINLGDVLRQVAREKEIDYERWVQALEDAMASAAKKQHRIKEPVRAHVEPGDRQVRRLDRQEGRRARRGSRGRMDASKRPCPTRATRKSETRSSRRSPPKDWAGSRPNPRSRCSTSGSAKPSARRSTTSTSTASARWSTAPSSASSAATSSSTSGAPRPHRSPPGTGAPRALQPGRAHPRRHRRSAQAAQGAADRAVANRPAAPGQALRDGSARDLRRHRDDQGRGARARASAPRSPSTAASATSIRSAPASA